MKKLIVVSFILFFLLSQSVVLAVDINMNITEDFNDIIDNSSNNEIIISNDVVENVVNTQRFYIFSNGLYINNKSRF